MILAQMNGSFLSLKTHPVGLKDEGTFVVSANLLDRPVLIIEDEAVIAWMFEDVLEALGFADIMLAANADQARSLAQSQAPGIIISDINLGARSDDGIAAVSEILAGETIPVLFITGNASTDALDRIARGVPGARVLRKPITPQELRHAVASLTEALH